MNEYSEDLYFVYGMLKLEYKVGLNEKATQFCTHTKYFDKTFCVHKLFHYQLRIFWNIVLNLIPNLMKLLVYGYSR